MKFLNDESVFIALVLLAGSLWAVAKQPGLFSSFLVLTMTCITLWLALRMDMENRP